MKIFGIKHHGLGDSLAMSTLPERLTKEHGQECKFYEPDIKNFKNREIFDLVWKRNPYIKGLSNTYPNSGCTAGGTPSDANTVVWHMERLHGLFPENQIPRIYYDPTFLPEINGVTIIDINSFHYLKGIKKNKEKIQELVLSLAGINAQYVKNSKDIGIEDINEEFFGEIYNPFTVDSLEHYCDVIFTCKRFICANSGGNSLAAAMQTDNAHIIMTDENKGYTYPNNNYHYV